jgi:hypothetical protein
MRTKKAFSAWITIIMKYAIMHNCFRYDQHEDMEQAIESEIQNEYASSYFQDEVHFW